jgi:hypothetical protein
VVPLQHAVQGQHYNALAHHVPAHSQALKVPSCAEQDKELAALMLYDALGEEMAGPVEVVVMIEAVAVAVVAGTVGLIVLLVVSNDKNRTRKMMTCWTLARRRITTSTNMLIDL